MGQKHEWVDLQTVQAAAHQLSEAASAMTKVASQMRAAGLEKAIFAWAVKQSNAIQTVAGLAATSIEMAAKQVAASELGVMSEIERDKIRSEKDEARRKERDAAKRKASPAKPRGRPRKKKAQ